MKATFTSNNNGSWTLNSNQYDIGTDQDFINNMVETNQWSHSDAINQCMHNVNSAIQDANLVSPEQIFDLLMSSSFESWYEEEFKDFVDGEPDAPSKKDIMDFISRTSRY